MAEAPAFFLPTFSPDVQESVYANLANWCGNHVPEPKSRIVSIVFEHDGAVWTATVGEPLRGTSSHMKKSRGKKIEVPHSHGDPAIVLAIFPGPPCYKVVTNEGIPTRVGSRWANPLLTGQPQHVGYFSVAKAAG